MNDLRRRKLREANGRPIAKRKRKEIEPSSIHRSLLCVIISAAILTIFSLLYIENIPWYLAHRVVDSVAKSVGYHKPVHAVVIDAGSTGSRVLAFTFHQAYLDGHLVLDKELFEYIKPGLSSFKDDPAQAAVSISGLLEKAKGAIPEEYWRTTPLVLRATAGLRLLPHEKAQHLLETLRQLFQDAPFLTNRESVAIMDGTDEGIMSWFTVNFLLERMSGDPAKTVAALDLGGGSTQVTFSPTTPETLSQKEYIHQGMSPRGPVPVYTHSYLGLGLMSGRKAVVTLDQEGEYNVTSKCVNPLVKGRKLHYAGHDYFVSGMETGYPTLRVTTDQFREEEEVPVVSFDDCADIVRDYVKSHKANRIGELQYKQINAFSYYFDRAAGVGLIDPLKGGIVQVFQYREAAKLVCQQPNVDQPFACLDLIFIWSLLEDGFGLRPNTTLYLFKKINGHEISWALGLAFGLLKGN